MNRQDLHDNVFARVVDGWEEDVYYQGQVVGKRRVYADSGVTTFVMRLHGFIPKDSLPPSSQGNVAQNFADLLARDIQREKDEAAAR